MQEIDQFKKFFKDHGVKFGMLSLDPEICEVSDCVPDSLHGIPCLWLGVAQAWFLFEAATGKYLAVKSDEFNEYDLREAEEVKGVKIQGILALSNIPLPNGVIYTPEVLEALDGMEVPIKDGFGGPIIGKGKLKFEGDALSMEGVGVKDIGGRLGLKCEIARSDGSGTPDEVVLTLGEEGPRYKHACGNCTFLGCYGLHDLYYCIQGGLGGRPTVTARFGDGELDSLKSSLGSSDRYGALEEARRRARNRGLRLKPEKIEESAPKKEEDKL